MEKRIRLAQPEDATAIHTIYAPIVENTAISFELTPPTVDEMRLRITQTLRAYPWLVYEEQGLVQGYVYASQHRSRLAYQWSVDVSAYIDERNRGRGIARALYTSLFALLRLQGFYNAYAGISLPNIASVRLHEAMGMQPLGIYHSVGYKKDLWYDVGWWQVALQPYQPSPVPPLLISAAQALNEWDTALQSGLTGPHW
jgi:L-amino acid N-acyltransferase YncA